MVLISIDPFAVRKIFLVLLALLCFSAFCFADPVFMAQHYVPATGEIETSLKPAQEYGRRSEARPGLMSPAESLPFGVLDLPMRYHMLPPGLERSDEIFKEDNPSVLFRQSA